MRILRPLIIFSTLSVIISGLISCGKDPDMEFSRFVEKHSARVDSLERAGSLAYWEAARSGSNDDFRKYAEAHMELEKIYTNREEFEYVRNIRENGDLKDNKLKRIADLLYLSYKGNQMDPVLLKKIVELSSEVEKKFGTFRPVVDGVELAPGEVMKVFKTSTDSEYRRKVWEAGKKVGPRVVCDLLKLVRARNEAARAIGYRDYYEMSLTLSEQDEEKLSKVFAELEELTREPYLRLKGEIDGELSARYGITPEEMRPWHYHDPFFQEAPAVGEIDLDMYYKGKDLAAIAAGFYAGIGMPVEDILSRSDLYEREGKNPHAFCTDIDRQGDIRILANIIDNANWMDTMLHELGHAVYDKYIDRELPFLLRRFPHLCTTEASAMFFGRLSHDSLWMKDALGLSDGEVEKIRPAFQRSRRLKQLIFARWVQVMFNFEKELYRDPEQDLNSLWWDMVEKYQFVKRPEGRDEPDYASKIHITSSPVYYHNYMLGELIASQFYHHISDVFLEQEGEIRIYGNRAVGEYFRNTVFRPGALYPWMEHIRVVTGEPLSARYFVEQFVVEQD